MNRLRQQLTRVRARAAFPVLGIAMSLATLVAGLERTSFLGEAAGVEQVGSESVASSTVEAIKADLATLTGTGSSAASYATLDTDVSHARIDKWVTRLTTSLRGDFKQSLQRMAKYEDMINAKIDARGMPRELIYVALIESNFNPTAKSPVKAVGMWQFMSATARQFGLSVGRRVDERKNPALATDAALAYLDQLHDRFGSWYLAAAAYNSGQGTVSKAMRTVTGRTKGTDADFFRIMSKLPKETQDYVPKLIASARVGADPARYGM
ncbi:MAG TPA: lytic transglycosylase domain-containing protein [Gemmatimonadaceae bacterium]|nr:lytic transglycosylase domain-containing protein [Gemmatimonadaceae bacterium]